MEYVYIWSRSKSDGVIGIPILVPAMLFSGTERRTVAMYDGASLSSLTSIFTLPTCDSPPESVTLIFSVYTLCSS